MEKDDKVVIFGNGIFGKKVFAALKGIGFDIVAVVDKYPTKDVLDVKNLELLIFDKMILATINGGFADEMMKMVLEIGIDRSRILTIDSKLLLKQMNLLG